MKINTGGLPYLLWMGECIHDHRINSMKDLYASKRGYTCVQCKIESKRQSLLRTAK